MKEEIIELHHCATPNKLICLLCQKSYSDVTEETGSSKELMSYSVGNEATDKLTTNR